MLKKINKPSFYEGVYPCSLKLAKVIPLFKEHKKHFQKIIDPTYIFLIYI